MNNSIKTHICKYMTTQLKMWENKNDKFNKVSKTVEVEIQNPSDDVVEFNLIYDNVDHTYEMSANQARNIANMLFAVANEARDEYADMLPPVVCKPTKKKR